MSRSSKIQHHRCVHSRQSRVESKEAYVAKHEASCVRVITEVAAEWNNYLENASVKPLSGRLWRVSRGKGWRRWRREIAGVVNECPAENRRFHLSIAIYTGESRIERSGRPKELKIGLANREIVHGLGSPAIYERSSRSTVPRYSPLDSYHGIGRARYSYLRFPSHLSDPLATRLFLHASNNVRVARIAAT